MIRVPTRRKFLEETMLATAAACALPGRTSLAVETEKGTTTDEWSHAVIGCRIRGRVHAQEFGRIPGVRVAYVCDPDRDLAEELATQVEKEKGYRPQTFQDMRRIFDDKRVKTVSIATPNHWHALAAIWAMQSGKDVYVEKPVSNTIEEGERMVQAARKLGRICQAGTQNRSVGAHAAIVDYLRAGKLGEVSLARTIIYGKRGSIGPRGTYPIPSNIDHNLWLGPASQQVLMRPQLHYDWHWVWDTGNGELGNNNIHYVDLVRWMLGLDGFGDSVWSIGGRLGYEDAGETPNTQMVVHTFGKQTIIQEVRGLKSGPFSEKFKGGWILYGTEGFIAGTSLFDPSGNLVQTFKGPTENHFANFIEAARSGRPEDLNAEIAQGHQSTALCHVGNISHRLGETAGPGEIEQSIDQAKLHPEVMTTYKKMVSHLKENEVDLDKQRLTVGRRLQIRREQTPFVDSMANALVGREYRAPFVLPSEASL
jgi:predicted dehydrogenase